MKPTAVPTASPHTLVKSTEELGAIARTHRAALGLGLRQVVPVAGVGIRFLSEFERGKPTAEIGKVMAALHGIGLELAVVPREDADKTYGESLSKRLGMAFPYDWSNSHMDEPTFIRHVLRARRFDDVLRLVGHFGLDRVSRELPDLGEPTISDQVAAMLSRIYQGMLLAQTGRADGLAA